LILKPLIGPRRRNFRHAGLGSQSTCALPGAFPAETHGNGHAWVSAEFQEIANPWRMGRPSNKGLTGFSLFDFPYLIFNRIVAACIPQLFDPVTDPRGPVAVLLQPVDHLQALGEDGFLPVPFPLLGGDKRIVLRNVL
jgi:hypothetical protein